MTIEEFVNKAIRVPFVDRGRDYTGWDCWGEIYCFHRDVKNILLPIYLDYSSTSAYSELHELFSAGIKNWIAVDKYAPGDVALFTIAGQKRHVALVIDQKSALHTEKRLGTFIEPLKGLVWGKRLEGVYRYAGHG
jgi:probable lipoprotein NlpC